MQLIRCRLWYLYPLGVFFLAYPSTFEWRRLHSRISNTLSLRWFNLKQLKYLVKYFELNFLLYWLIDISKFIYESFTSIFRVDFKFFWSSSMNSRAFLAHWFGQRMHCFLPWLIFCTPVSTVKFRYDICKTVTNRILLLCVFTWIELNDKLNDWKFKFYCEYKINKHHLWSYMCGEWIFSDHV